jgi:hypothetical protein
MKYTIDRFEEDFAVLEDEGRSMRSVPRGLLPPGLREGDAVELTDGKYFHCDNSADRERINAKFEKLKK